MPSTFTAASVAHDDVVAAIALANDGDTVIVPAGSAIWTSAVNVGKKITLRGQTTVNSVTGVCSDLTVVTDSVPIDPNNSTARFMTLTNSGRVTGFTFQNGTRPQVPENGGFAIAGTFSGFRVDNCHFKPLNQRQYMFSFGQAYGVVDHNVFEFTAATNVGQVFCVFMESYGGRTLGDGAFADVTAFGTDKFFFFEDNYLTNTTSFPTLGVCDSYFGGRYVFRYNHCYNTNLQVHGTEGFYRGGRAFEIYNNDFHYSQFIGSIGQLRSGVLAIHDNKWYGIQPGPLLLQPYRSFVAVQGFGPATGLNSWDGNDPANPYVTGTCTANGTGVMTDSTKTWTVDQWVNYTVFNTTTGHIGLIQSNTATTLAFFVYSEAPNPLFSVGNAYKINKVLGCYDQPGRGIAPLVTRDGSNNPTNPTVAGFDHQALEPCYSWNNKFNNGVSDIADQNIAPGIQPNCIQANRDFFNNTVMPGYTPYAYPHPLISGTAPPAPAITSPLSASGTTGVAFTYTITASNGPTSFGASGLPSGLTLNASNGLISGTPLFVGITSVTLSAINPSGTGFATLVINVASGIHVSNPPAITSPVAAAGVQNQFFSYSITATNAPTSYGAINLPAGLGVNAGNGIISGTPTAVAVTVVTISATNDGGTTTAPLTITITAIPPSVVGKHPKRWKNSMARRHQ